MRIWDIDPGYLNRQSLLGEHRELHGIVSIIRNDKKGYSRHPETLRWKGCGWALAQRHRSQASEMNLRGYVDKTPVRLRANPGKWPDVFTDFPGNQLSILSEKYRQIGQGRIPLPRNAQQLWAQHKYSVMARDIAEYVRIGRWASSRKSGSEMNDLCRELVLLLRLAPDEGNLRNALCHMWGYVSEYSSFPGRVINEMSCRNLCEQIRRLVFANNVAYLKESTAIGELQAWR